MKALDKIQKVFSVHSLDNEIVFSNGTDTINLSYQELKSLLKELKQFIPKTKAIKKEAVNDIAIKLSEYLLTCIRNNNPKFNITDTTIKRWSNDIDKMIRIDKREPIEVAQVITFSQSNSFWKKNILSGTKLRKHFDRLWIEIKDKTDNTFNYKPPTL